MSTTPASPSEKIFRSERLNDSGRIREVRLKGHKFQAKPFLIFRSPNGLEGPRLAVAITRKAGPSVLRNKARRKIREFFRKNKKVLGSYDYFFYTTRDLKPLTQDDWNSFAQTILKTCGRSSSAKRVAD